MLLLKFLTTILALFCFLCLCRPSTAIRFADDCETLRARCRICVKSIHEGPDEDNMFGRLNRGCTEEVGRTYAWRNLGRCDMIYLRCRGINETLTCANLATLSGMSMRLQ